LNIADPTNAEALRGNFLPKPLPVVRIEVAQPAAWSDLISGLRALGFAVHIGRDTPVNEPVVRVTDSSIANNAVSLGTSGWNSSGVTCQCLAVSHRARGWAVIPISELTAGEGVREITQLNNEVVVHQDSSIPRSRAASAHRTQARI
jgi:hypothetical protein